MKKCTKCGAEMNGHIRKGLCRSCTSGTRKFPYKKRENITGSKNHSWKGGKAKCLHCNKILFSRHQKTCKQHINGLNKKITKITPFLGEKHTQWKGGISFVPDYKAIIEANRRARIRKSEGTFSFVEWEALKMKYRYMCLCCKKCEPEIRLTADHIVPIVKGGSNDISNIQPLCGICNSIKKTKATNFIETL